MRALMTLVLATLATGCIVYTDDVDDHTPRTSTPEPIQEYAPVVVDAEAGCYWDRSYRDDIWYFQADVDDGNGIGDVVSVWADVYDEFANGVFVESFELYPTDDPYVFFSDWLGSSTHLDCLYEGYTVDFVVYDQLELTGSETVWAYVE